MAAKKQSGWKVALSLAIAASCASAGQAANLRYYPGTDSPLLNLNMPLSTIGNLPLPNGRLELVANEVHIEAVPEGLFDSRVVITGVIVHTTPVDEKSTSMRALIYFYAGNWLDSLHTRPISELIHTINGKIYDGQVVGGDDKSLSVRRPDKTVISVDFRQIASIDSPRAFWLDMPLRNVHSTAGYVVGQTFSADFEPTVGARNTLLASNSMMHPYLLGDERGVKNGSLAAYAAADIATFLLPFIAVPIVFDNQYKGQHQLLNATNNSAALQSAEVQSLVNRFGF
ncbi:MAG TPA: hypothetical protein V6C69_04545 [Trichormus sp.]|jgi:hypothetical protein